MRATDGVWRDARSGLFIRPASASGGSAGLARSRASTGSGPAQASRNLGVREGARRDLAPARESLSAARKTLSLGLFPRHWHRLVFLNRPSFFTFVEGARQAQAQPHGKFTPEHTHHEPQLRHCPFYPPD